MSLINEALKKAQSERYGKDAPSARAPGVGAPPSERSVRPVVMLIALSFVAAGAGAAYYFFMMPKDAPVAVTTPRPVRPVAPPVAPAKPVVAPPVTTPALKAAPVVVPPPVPVVEKPTPSGPKPNPAVAALVDVMRVSLSRADSGRCVVNGVVYRVGDKVMDEPRIILLKVSDNDVVFMDVAGCEYTKSSSH